MTKTTRTNAHPRNADENEPVLTEAQHEASRRKLHDFLSFWRVCGEKRCKRGKGCRGEVPACAARHVPLVPDDAKTWLYKAIECRRDGLSPQQACDEANRHVAAVNAVLARFAQRDAEARAAGTTTTTSSDAPSGPGGNSSPRVRPPVRARAL